METTPPPTTTPPANAAPPVQTEPTTPSLTSLDPSQLNQLTKEQMVEALMAIGNSHNQLRTQAQKEKEESEKKAAALREENEKFKKDREQLHKQQYEQYLQILAGRFPQANIDHFRSQLDQHFGNNVVESATVAGLCANSFTSGQSIASTEAQAQAIKNPETSAATSPIVGDKRGLPAFDEDAQSIILKAAGGYKFQRLN